MGATTIVACAIKMPDGAIETMAKPARHKDIIHSIYLRGIYRPDVLVKGVQGFVTNTGEFVNRSEAYVIAVRSGQVTPKQQLFSGYLW